MSPRPLIMDVDPGVDDMAALLMALASPELDVLGVSAVAGNVPLEAAVDNATRVLALAGRTDVPLLAGRGGPLLRDQVFGRHAALGTFSDAVMPPANPIVRGQHSVEFIAAAAREAAVRNRPLTLCTCGPLSNVALALALGPQVREGIGEIVIMGGAFTALGNRVPWAEFNMLADPHAAAMVFASGISITLFPLDVTQQVLLTHAHLDQIRSRCGRIGHAFAEIFAASDRSDPRRYGRPGGPVHDALPVGYLVAPQLFEIAPAEIGIVTAGPQMGHTYADFWTANTHGHIRVARSVDETEFIALLCDRLAALAHHRLQDTKEIS